MNWAKDEQADLTAKYGVRSLPTMLFMKDGEIVDQMVGASPKQAIEDKINSLL